LFCSKCGKEAPEDAVFCANCGAGLTGGQPAKKRTLSTIAGIVEIVAGCFAVVTTIIFLVIMATAEGLEGWFVLFPMALAIISALAIIGGVCALRRKHWAMALTGAIAVIWPTTVLGIAALVLTIMARNEFERKPTPR
jgi:hypothetical protein